MVSSVCVLLTCDAGEFSSLPDEAGEGLKGDWEWEVALGVGEEGMFCMEIKAWHAMYWSRDK